MGGRDTDAEVMRSGTHAHLSCVWRSPFAQNFSKPPSSFSKRVA
jgi:hypothetical protein